MGDKLLAYFGLQGGLAGDRVHVEMDLEEVANKQQEISIEINGELAFAGTVDQGTVSFEVPYPQDETIGMVIHMPDAGSETDAKTSCLMIKDIQFSITASSGLR